MALTSDGEAAPLSEVEPMVDILCWERCLLMLFQPFVEALSAVVGCACARSRAEDEAVESYTK